MHTVELLSAAATNSGSNYLILKYFDNNVRTYILLLSWTNDCLCRTL